MAWGSRRRTEDGLELLDTDLGLLEQPPARSGQRRFASLLGNRRPSGGQAPDAPAAVRSAGEAAAARRGGASGEADLKPSAMRGREVTYGYVVVAILIATSALNLLVTHGPGAPKHPSLLFPALGLALSLGTGATLLTRNRLIVPFAAVIAAFFTTYTKTPASLTIPHLLALVAPLAYALVLTQRHRKAQLALQKSRPASQARGGSRRRAGKGGASAPVKGPAPNRRYTPPKAKRQQASRKAARSARR